MKRLKSPFFGPLFIAFVACNWKAIISLFYPQENWTIFQRIHDIKPEFYPDKYDVLIFVYLLPLAVAVFALTALPWIVTGLDWVGFGAIVRREKLREDRSKELSAYARQIQEFQLRNINLEQDNNKLRNAVKEFETKERDDGLRLHRVLEHFVNSDPFYKETIKKLYRATPQDIEWNDKVRLLQDMEIIENAGAGAYQLTNAGRQLARSGS